MVPETLAVVPVVHRDMPHVGVERGGGRRHDLVPETPSRRRHDDAASCWLVELRGARTGPNLCGGTGGRQERQHVHNCETHEETNHDRNQDLRPEAAADAHWTSGDRQVLRSAPRQPLAQDAECLPARRRRRQARHDAPDIVTPPRREGADGVKGQPLLPILNQTSCREQGARHTAQQAARDTARFGRAPRGPELNKWRQRNMNARHREHACGVRIKTSGTAARGGGRRTLPC